MKSITKDTHFKIKCLFFSFMLLVSLNSIGQNRSVSQDPQLGKIELADLNGYQLDENFIHPQQQVKLKLPVTVVTHGKAMPAGSCKIKIGFGSKISLDPSFDLNSVSLSNYFKWTSVVSGGETQVIGDLIAPLPADFNEVDVDFKVKGITEGRSTITANFLISNHNTSVILSDEDGTNNMSYLHYNITTANAPVPVTSINDLAKTDCSINVNFATDKEINLSNYEVEVSKDGISYVKVAGTPATNLTTYNLNFPLTKDLQSKILYVRIKSIDRAGRAVYSIAKTVDGSCSANWKLDIYPNPASGIKSVVIRAVEGIFNDKYMVTMIDMSGKQVSKNELQLSNVPSFKLDLGNVAAGKYLIKVVNNDGSQSAVLKFEKM